MIRLLEELGRLLGTSSDAYRVIRRRFFKLIGLIFVCSLFAVALNFWGFKAANAVIGCILPFIALYVFTSPTVVGGAFLIGAIVGPSHPMKAISEVSEIVGRFFVWLLVISSIFFLLVATLPLGRNFWAVLVVYLCASILVMFNIRGMRKTRGLLWTYAIIALVASVGSMIPSSAHIKLCGHDFFAWSRISAIDEGVARIEEAKREADEKAIAVALEIIEQKIVEGQTLSDNEQRIYNGAVNIRDQETIPGKIKSMLGSVSPAITKKTTFVLNRGEQKGSLVHPDETKVYFNSNAPFVLLEKSGINTDGSFVFTHIDMPSGKSQRYFSWGGTPTVKGLTDGTQITVSF